MDLSLASCQVWWPTCQECDPAGSVCLLGILELLPPELWGTANYACEDTLQVWSEGLEASAPLSADAPSQKAWDAPCVAASLKALQAAAPDSVTQACLLAACRKEAGAWLQALPVSALDLRMEDEIFHVATGLRLGMPLCQPHTCQQCGTPVDCLGTHGLHCWKSVGRHPRHSAINGLVKRSLGSAKIAIHLEPAGICRSDGKWPDKATVLPWRRILV